MGWRVEGLACVTVESGAAYIYVKPPGASVWRSLPAGGLYLDLDGLGQLAGIEVLDPRSIPRLRERLKGDAFWLEADFRGRTVILFHLSHPVGDLQRCTLQQIAGRYGIPCCQEIDLLFWGSEFVGLEIWSVEDYDRKFLFEGPH